MEEIVGYKVILYDAFSIVDIKTTDSLQLEFTNLTQFSKFYVTVQALTRSGYSLPSQQLPIHTKGLFIMIFVLLKTVIVGIN